MATLTLQQAQDALATQQAKLDAANASYNTAVKAKKPTAVLAALQANIATAKEGVANVQATISKLQPTEPTKSTTTVDPRVDTIKALLAPGGPMGAPTTNKTTAITQNINGTNVTFYPTPQGWVQTQVTGAQGYVTTQALPALQQQQTTANTIYQKQQADAAAKKAADAKAVADAAAAKAAQDAAAKAAATKAAADAAAAKTAQINTLVGQYSSATNLAQVDSITSQLLKLGYTPTNKIITDAKTAAQKIVTQQQTVDFNAQLAGATTQQQVTDIVAKAKAAGITVDPAPAQQKITLTQQIQTAQKQDDVNNLLAKAQTAGIQLDPAVVSSVNAKFALQPNQYVDASTIDPTVLKDYGIKTSTVDGKSVIQTVNPNASGYVNPSELVKYQQLTAKIYATQQAQTNFTLPDPSTAGRGQTVTSPNGVDTYQAVPADPVAGTPAQWYKVSADGASYTPVNNKGVADTTATALNRDAYFKQYDTAAQNIQTKQYNDYVASIPTTTVGSKTYQTQDPTVANYISPENLAYTQQQYQQQQQGYQQLVDQLKAVNPADVVYTGGSLVDPKSGTVYQNQFADMPGYVAPGSEWGKLENQLGAHAGYSANTYNQYRADNEVKRVENAYNAYQSTFQNSKQGDPQPVMSAKNLPEIGAGAKPLVAADTGITYYPTANGWKQSSDTTAANYQPANEIQMKLPEPQYQEGMDIYYSNVRGPDGTMYTPKWANPNTGEAGGYMQSSNPSAPGYVDQQTFNKISQQQVTAGYAGTQMEYTDPLTGQQIQTRNPYAPGYMSTAQYQNNLNQYAQQQSAEREIFGIDDLGRSIDDFVNKTVGWGTIASIVGSSLGGPLGAALANAATGAIQGKSPGEILKSAALTYALAYGTQALAEQLGPALEEATNSAVDSGMLDPEVLGEAADEFAGAGYGDYMPDIVENYGTATPIEPDFGVADDFFGPVQPDSIYDIADDFGTPTDYGTPDYTGADYEFGGYEPQPVAPEVPDSIYDIADDFGSPVQPQAPTDLQSTGFSDSAPGTIYEGPNGQEIVLDSGKTVSLADYNAAVEAGNPVSVDGMLQTGGSGIPGAGTPYTVEVTGAPYVEGSAPSGFTAPEGMRLANIDEAVALSNAGGTATTLPDGSFAWIVPEGTLPEVVVTATREGILTPEMIMGGAAVVGGAVAISMGAGGATAPAAVPAPTPTPAPVEPTPTPAPVEPTPTPTPTPTEPVPVEPTPTPTEPVPVTPPPAPTPEVPVTDITPTPVEPVTPPEVPPGEVPVTDVTPTPVEPTPVEPTPTPTEPVPTNPNEVPVIDKSTPYTGEWSNESVLERYLNKTLTYGDILTLVGAGMVAPTVLDMLGLAPEVPTRPGYGPLAPINWGSAGGLTKPGLNPGYLTFGGQPQPFYQTTDPVQSQYYWGIHPYMKTMEDLGTYNQVPEAPAQPFGVRESIQPFDVNAFIQQQGLTPQPTSAIPGYNNAPFTAYQVPQPLPIVNTNLYTAPAPTTIPTAVPQVNMNFTPVQPIPLDQIPSWAPGQADLTQPVAPIG